MPAEYLTRSEVADMLGITSLVLSQRIHHGKAPPPARRMDQTLLWKRIHVEQWILMQNLRKEAMSDGG